MAARSYKVTELPESGIAASAAFFCDHLEPARALIGCGAQDSLAIILPPVGPDHKDWRRALARDLARAHAPARVNVVAGDDDESVAALLHYLDNAKGVTGHYLETHD